MLKNEEVVCEFDSVRKHRNRATKYLRQYHLRLVGGVDRGSVEGSIQLSK